MKGRGAHDAQGLLLRRVGKSVVATKACSKRREGRITFRRQHVEFEYTPHANVRSHSSFTMGLQRPSQVCAVRGEDLPLSCASWKLDPEPLRNIGFLFRVNSWNVWSQVKNSEGDRLLAALNLNFKPILVQRATAALSSLRLQVNSNIGLIGSGAAPGSQRSPTAKIST